MQKNYPSIKRIAEYLKTDLSTAKAIRGVMDGTIPPDQFPKTQAWINQCYNMPSKHELKMSALNELAGGFGVEVLGDVNNYPPRIDCEYVNMGDTYTPTICFYQGRYILACWGDIAERLPNLA